MKLKWLFKRIVIYPFAIFTILISIEIPFRIYDYGFKYRDLQYKFSKEKADIPLPFEEIQVYLFKTGKCIRDPRLIWRYSPRVNNPEMNSFGIRTLKGKELVRTKNIDTYRIIILGGSHPFGLRLRYQDAYAYQLEELFRKEKCGLSKVVEVINAAVPGYSTVQVLNFLRYYMIGYNPDLVIIDAGNNDNIRLTSAYSLKDAQAVKISPFACKIINLADRSSFFWYYQQFIYKIKNLFKITNDKTIVTYPTRVSLEESRHNLEEMKKIALENNFKIIFLSQMRLNNEGRLKRGFGEKVEPYLDIYAQLKGRQDISGYFIDNIHGSVIGHKEIARIIYDYLMSNHLIPLSSSVK